MRSAAQLALFSLAACGDPVGSVGSVFVGLGPASTPETFYDLPFPNDVRRGSNGRIDLTGFPSQSSLLDNYIGVIENGLDGFGLNSGIYFRFDGELDPDSLPDPTGSLADDAAVYLVNVDPASAAYGERTPIKLRFSLDPGSSIGPAWLAVLPYPGFPLAEGTTHAVVVSDRVRSADGGSVVAGSGFAAVRSRDVTTDPELAPVQAAMSPLWAWLDQPGGDEREGVVTATVFTTQHATGIVGLLKDRIDALASPASHDLVVFQDRSGFTIWDGIYEAPNFQRGAVPYDDGGGDIQLAADGLPEVQTTESLRFSVAVPDGPTPATGWPIAIYQHGTGGSYHSFLSDGTAAGLAAEGIASVSMDQVLHGPRNPGGNPALDFFNFINPLAGRDNVIQGAADSFSLARMILGLSFLDVDGLRTIRFDPDRLMYFGHSQGSTTGAPYVAFADNLKGAVLSGAGGVLYLALLNKTQPVDIPALLAAVLRDEPLDEYNPSLALLQMWIDRADSVNYGPLIVREPPGHAPTPVYVSEGFIDHYSPIPTCEAFAVSIGTDLVAPTVADVLGLTLRGRSTLTAPVANNLDGATAVLVQYNQQPGSDGHFVVFDVPSAMIQSRQFLGTLARTGTATLVAP
jgi:hypothetical protein